MPASTKRPSPRPSRVSRKPITAADSALAEQTLREKFEQGKRTHALSTLKICVDTATALQDHDALAAIHGHMGGHYLGNTLYKEAVRQLQSAIEHATLFGSALKEVHWRDKLAWTLKRMGHSERAFEEAATALAVARAHGDVRGECSVLLTTGATHENVGDEEEALQMYKAALVEAHRIGDHRMIYNALHYIGSHYSYIVYDHTQARPIWESGTCSPSLGRRSWRAVRMLPAPWFHGSESQWPYRQRLTHCTVHGWPLHRIIGPLCMPLPGHADSTTAQSPLSTRDGTLRAASAMPGAQQRHHAT
jgi:hypothetical protein